MNQEIVSQLDKSEKISLYKNTFENNEITQSTKLNFVKNIGDFIVSNFEKIDGFDYRWSSLISNNPLLFEDIDYLRVKPYIDNQITEEEIEAYRRGDLREVYATFDNMLVCNLKYYDRIMSYATMVFMKYITIEDKTFTQKLDDLPSELFLTPTMLWCCALASPSSTDWELTYAWGSKLMITPIANSTKTMFELSFKRIYKNHNFFGKFLEYASFRTGVEGFRNVLLHDKTSNRKLANVCSKFTKTSTAISEKQLDTIIDLYNTYDELDKKLYLILEDCLSVMFSGDKTQFAIYIYCNEFFIYTSKFSIRVSKNKNGSISKDYLANSYECFAAEEYLVNSIKYQLEWARFQLESKFDYDKSILKNLLQKMLEENYKNIVCVKRMNNFGITSRVTFSGIFANIRIKEDLLFDGRIIKTQINCFSRKNTANYLIERGYYIFGLSEDITALLENESINKTNIVAHYANYCVPVLNHMESIIKEHKSLRDDIAKVSCDGFIAPERLNNHNIILTDVSTTDTKDIFRTGLSKQNNLIGRKGYWKAVQD